MRRSATALAVAASVFAISSASAIAMQVNGPSQPNAYKANHKTGLYCVLSESSLSVERVISDGKISGFTVASSVPAGSTCGGYSVYVKVEANVAGTPTVYRMRIPASGVSTTPNELGNFSNGAGTNAPFIFNDGTYVAQAGNANEPPPNVYLAVNAPSLDETNFTKTTVEISTSAPTIG